MTEPHSKPETVEAHDAREAIARMLVPYWPGGFENQGQTASGQWANPPYTPNARAYEIADKALAIVAARVPAQCVDRNAVIEECRQAAINAFMCFSRNDYVLEGPGGMGRRMVYAILALKTSPAPAVTPTIGDRPGNPVDPEPGAGDPLPPHVQQKPSADCCGHPEDCLVYPACHHTPREAAEEMVEEFQAAYVRFIDKEPGALKQLDKLRDGLVARLSSVPPQDSSPASLDKTSYNAGLLAAASLAEQLADGVAVELPGRTTMLLGSMNHDPATAQRATALGIAEAIRALQTAAPHSQEEKADLNEETLTDFICDVVERLGPGCDEQAIAQAILAKYTVRAIDA